jgi:oligoribonuclease (3'-5' exoribonuclease)
MIKYINNTISMANLIEELFKNLIKQDYCNLFMKLPRHVEETVYRTIYLSKIKQYAEGDSTVTKVYFNCSRGTECYQPACP